MNTRKTFDGNKIWKKRNHKTNGRMMNRFCVAFSIVDFLIRIKFVKIYFRQHQLRVVYCLTLFDGTRTSYTIHNLMCFVIVNVSVSVFFLHFDEFVFYAKRFSFWCVTDENVRVRLSSRATIWLNDKGYQYYLNRLRRIIWKSLWKSQLTNTDRMVEQ